MNIFLLKYSILFFIFLFSSVLSYEHWTMVTDETFNLETSYDDVKWLLFFYKKDCQKCDQLYSLLNTTMQEYINKKVGFVFIDSINCPWLINRFNVTYVPKIILLEKDWMYNYHSHYTKQNIMNFIDKKKFPDSAIPKPSGAKLKYIYKTFLTLVSQKINSSMQYYLDKFRIPIHWNKYYSLFFLCIKYN